MNSTNLLKFPDYGNENDNISGVLNIIFRRAFEPEWEAGPYSAQECVTRELALWSSDSLEVILSILQSSKMTSISDDELVALVGHSDYLPDYGKMTHIELLNFTRTYLLSIIKA
jgi:hypothetical protein